MLYLIINFVCDILQKRLVVDVTSETGHLLVSCDLTQPVQMSGNLPDVGRVRRNKPFFQKVGNLKRKTPQIHYFIISQDQWAQVNFSGPWKNICTNCITCNCNLTKPYLTKFNIPFPNPAGGSIILALPQATLTQPLTQVLNARLLIPKVT